MMTIFFFKKKNTTIGKGGEIRIGKRQETDTNRK